MFVQSSWDEQEVLHLIRIIRQTIVEITSNRDAGI